MVPMVPSRRFVATVPDPDNVATTANTTSTTNGAGAPVLVPGRPGVRPGARPGGCRLGCGGTRCIGDSGTGGHYHFCDSWCGEPGGGPCGGVATSMPARAGALPLCSTHVIPLPGKFGVPRRRHLRPVGTLGATPPACH